MFLVPVRTTHVQPAERRRELGAFLRACRARLRPADVGIPAGPGLRRTPGLRREELSQLAGVGLTWYTWLEQGRPIPASRPVLTALARALRLDRDEQRHLLTLAGVPDSMPETDAETAEVAAPVRRLLDRLLPNPAYVRDSCYDVLAWNASQAALWPGLPTLPPLERNLVWQVFTSAELRRLLVDWETRARALLAHFRAAAGEHAGHSRYTWLIEGLRQASPDFRAWWDEYRVGAFQTDVNVLDHPRVGRLHLDLFELRLAHAPGLTLVLHTPVGPADQAALGHLLPDDARR